MEEERPISTGSEAHRTRRLPVVLLYAFAAPWVVMLALHVVGRVVLELIGKPFVKCQLYSTLLGKPAAQPDAKLSTGGQCMWAHIGRLQLPSIPFQPKLSQLSVRTEAVISLSDLFKHTANTVRPSRNLIWQHSI